MPDWTLHADAPSARDVFLSEGQQLVSFDGTKPDKSVAQEKKNFVDILTDGPPSNIRYSVVNMYLSLCASTWMSFFRVRC